MGKIIAEREDEQEDGYFLEVDLEYPEKLHDKHNSYPMATEKFKIEEKNILVTIKTAWREVWS